MIREKRHFQEYKELLRPPRPGSIVKGKVIGKTRRGVFVDIEGYKTGRIPLLDIKEAGKDPDEIKVGEEISAKIIELEGRDGFVTLSLKKAYEDLNWQKLQELQEKGEEIEAKVMSANKGGLIFQVYGIQGFLPASQLSPSHYPKLKDPTPEKVYEKLKKFVGKKMKIKILTVEPKKGKLIFTEK